VKNISSTPYPQIIRHKFHFGNEIVEVASKLGIPDWHSLSPAKALIAEKIVLPGDAQVLYLGCGNGASAVLLSKQLGTGHLWLHDINFISVQMAEETLRLNRITNSQVFSNIDIPEQLVETCDIAIIELPKGRKLAQRWLAQAFQALRPGGALYLCGANRQGINPSTKDAELLFGESGVLGYKKGNRLVKFKKGQPEWPASGWWQTPGISPATWHEGTIQTLSGSFKIYSLPGIFSFDSLDEGTQLLLISLPDLHGKKILDLGCGYGAIGIEATRSGASSVDMLDVNLLAVAAADKNISHQKIAQARALASDVLSAVSDEKYDLILSNPPFHTGRDVDYQVANAFIQQSCQALEPGGQLLIVANKFIRYEKIMRSYFKTVEEIVQSPRYHILRGEN
jgi:16S rRNA (guanine1207-N2)-methyltransferase